MKIKLESYDTCVIARTERGMKLKKTNTSFEMFEWLAIHGFKNVEGNIFEKQEEHFEEQLKLGLFNIFTLGGI